MANTYCGKNCETCSSKEELNCSGCKTGRGNYMTGTCEIAACCRAEACNKCTECSMVADCKLFASSGQSSETRLSRTSEESVVTDYDLKKAGFLAKWVNVIFISGIISMVSSFISTLTDFYAPHLSICTTIADCILQIVILVALFALGKYEERFRHTAFLIIGVCILGIVSLFLGNGILSILIALIILILLLAYISCEANGYAAILRDIDIHLSAKWEQYVKLFFRAVIVLVITCVSAIVLVFFPPLLILWGVAIIGISIFLFALAIVRLVYLSQTVSRLKQLCRTHS